MRKLPPPTEEQQAIIDIICRRICTAIKARAGTGKTALLEMAVAKLVELFPTLSIECFVFAKAIQKEIENRMPMSVGVITVHAKAYRTLRASFGHLRIPNRNPGKWISDKMLKVDRMSYRFADKAASAKDRKACKDVIKFIRLTLTDHTDQNAIYEMCNERMIDLGENPELNIEFASKALQEHLDELSSGKSYEIDFEDMQWLCIMWNLSFDKADVLLIDEAQDISALARECIARCAKYDDDGKLLSTVVLVGDEMQAIFAFAGADNDSLSVLSKRFNCVEKPLTMNWRCAKRVIAEAQRLVPDIKASPNAIDGVVAIVSPKYFRANVKEGDMVMCRTNAPNVPPCIALIKEGKKATIAGQDIGEQIIEIIDTTKKTHKAYVELDYEEVLTMWHNDEKDRLKKRHAPATMMEALDDKVDIIRYFLSEGQKPNDIIDTIETIFCEAKDGVILSSIHRQKGQEAKTVWINNIKKIRMFRPDMTVVDHEQEFHLEYVAKTRAKEAMYYIDNDAEVDYIEVAWDGENHFNEDSPTWLTDIQIPVIEEDEAIQPLQVREPNFLNLIRKK